jgi:serine phosphatase RsbU (regulator of sigma subunit)
MTAPAPDAPAPLAEQLQSAFRQAALAAPALTLEAAFLFAGIARTMRAARPEAAVPLEREARRRLFDYLRDELIYFLQKLLSADYVSPTWLPPAREFHRRAAHMLREFGVFNSRSPVLDFSRHCIVERWYGSLGGAHRPLSARQVYDYFAIVRNRLYTLSDEQPFAFSDATRIVRRLLDDATDKLSFNEIYESEQKLRNAILGSIVTHLFNADEAELQGFAALAVIELSQTFTAALHQEFEAQYSELARLREAERNKALKERSELDRELRDAARQHRKSLQSALPADDPRVEFQVWYEPYLSSRLGGDYYRAIRLSENEYFLLIADISGHGVSAALYIPILRIALDRRANLLRKPDRLFAEVNEEIYGKLGESFVTAIAIHADFKSRRISYCNAGHPKAFLVQRGDPPRIRVRFLRQNSKVLGVFQNAEFRRDRIQLEDNARLVLYTDGLTETMNPSADMLGERGLLDLFKGTTEKPGVETIEHVKRALELFRNGARNEDDRTLLIADLFELDEREALRPRPQVAAAPL